MSGQGTKKPAISDGFFNKRGENIATGTGLCLFQYTKIIAIGCSLLPGPGSF